MDENKIKDDQEFKSICKGLTYLTKRIYLARLYKIRQWTSIYDKRFEDLFCMTLFAIMRDLREEHLIRPQRKYTKKLKPDVVYEKIKSFVTTKLDTWEKEDAEAKDKKMDTSKDLTNETINVKYEFTTEQMEKIVRRIFFQQPSLDVAWCRHIGKILGAPANVIRKHRRALINDMPKCIANDKDKTVVQISTEILNEIKTLPIPPIDRLDGMNNPAYSFGKCDYRLNHQEKLNVIKLLLGRAKPFGVFWSKNIADFLELSYACVKHYYVKNKNNLDRAKSEAVVATEKEERISQYMASIIDTWRDKNGNVYEDGSTHSYSRFYRQEVPKPNKELIQKIVGSIKKKYCSTTSDKMKVAKGKRSERLTRSRTNDKHTMMLTLSQQTDSGTLLPSKDQTNEGNIHMANKNTVQRLRSDLQDLKKITSARWIEKKTETELNGKTTVPSAVVEKNFKRNKQIAGGKSKCRKIKKVTEKVCSLVNNSKKKDNGTNTSSVRTNRLRPRTSCKQILNEKEAQTMLKKMSDKEKGYIIRHLFTSIQWSLEFDKAVGEFFQIPHTKIMTKMSTLRHRYVKLVEKNAAFHQMYERFKPVLLSKLEEWKTALKNKSLDTYNLDLFDYPKTEPSNEKVKLTQFQKAHVVRLICFELRNFDTSWANEIANKIGWTRSGVIDCRRQSMQKSDCAKNKAKEYRSDLAVARVAEEMIKAIKNKPVLQTCRRKDSNGLDTPKYQLAHLDETLTAPEKRNVEALVLQKAMPFGRFWCAKIAAFLGSRVATLRILYDNFEPSKPGLCSATVSLKEERIATYISTVVKSWRDLEGRPYDPNAPKNIENLRRDIYEYAKVTTKWPSDSQIIAWSKKHNVIQRQVLNTIISTRRLFVKPSKKKNKKW